MRKRTYASGFTLVELLITIAIIGILAGVVFVSLDDEADAADDTALILGIQSLRAPAKRLQLHRVKPTTTKICQELHGKLRGAGDYTDAWTAADVCDADGDTKKGEICCASNEREWIIWGSLSTYDHSAANSGGKDVYCIDHKDNVGEIDLTAPFSNGISGTFVTKTTSSEPSFKCK